MIWPLRRLIDINKAPGGATGFGYVGLREHTCKDDRGLKSNDLPADGIDRCDELLIATHQSSVDYEPFAFNAPMHIETRNVMRPWADRFGGRLGLA